jgi:hypothetical protein
VGIGERLRGRVTALLLLIAGLAVLVGPAIQPLMTPSSPSRPALAWSLCETPSTCRPVQIDGLRLDRPVTVLRTTFVADREQIPAPLSVHIVAMASGEVWWNGQLIGRNGRVGPDRAAETPGRFSAVLFVPPDRVRDGPNVVEVRLSAHHLWAPVARPIHLIAIGGYGDPLRGALVHYLPTLLAVGLLALALLFNVLLWATRRPPGSAAFAVMAGAVLCQAVIEAGKLIQTYGYPWQLGRLMGIVVFAALAAAALGSLASGFTGDRRTRLALNLALAIGLAVAVFGPPWWDAKALWACRCGLAILLAGAVLGQTGDRRGALYVGLACVAALGLSWTRNFLDTGYYWGFLALFGWWGIHAVRSLRREASIPAVALPALDDSLLSIPNGGSRHRVRAGDVLHIRAADDYCLVRLADGRELLSTANLSALMALAPERFLRIHRSHAVNPRRIAAVHRTGRFARTVEMEGGERLGVGRTYWARLEAGLIPAKPA